MRQLQVSVPLFGRLVEVGADLAGEVLVDRVLVLVMEEVAAAAIGSGKTLEGFLYKK